MGNQQVSHVEQSLYQVPDLCNYFVDVFGNLFSTVRNIKPKQLKPYQHYGKSKNPYLRVRIGGSLQLVHRVVASAKLGRPLESHEVVNHLNGDTLDNSMSNLEVVTHRENVRHAVENKLYCSGSAWHSARGRLT